MPTSGEGEYMMGTLMPSRADDNPLLAAVMSLSPTASRGVVVGLVRLMAHQGTHVALRVIVLAFAKAVVDEEGRAAP